MVKTANLDSSYKHCLVVIVRRNKIFYFLELLFRRLHKERCKQLIVQLAITIIHCLHRPNIYTGGKALRQNKIADLDRLWLSRKMAKGLSAEDTKGPVQFVGTWSQYHPADERPMPVAIGEDGASALQGYERLFSIHGIGRTDGEPFFEELADAVDLLVAARLGSGDLIRKIGDLQDPSKRAEVRAALIREFFYNDPNILTDNGRGFSINRTAFFKRIVAEYAARAEIRKSA